MVPVFLRLTPVFSLFVDSSVVALSTLFSALYLITWTSFNTTDFDQSGQKSLRSLIFRPWGYELFMVETRFLDRIYPLVAGIRSVNEKSS